MLVQSPDVLFHSELAPYQIPSPTREIDQFGYKKGMFVQWSNITEFCQSVLNKCKDSEIVPSPQPPPPQKKQNQQPHHLFYIQPSTIDYFNEGQSIYSGIPPLTLSSMRENLGIHQTLKFMRSMTENIHRHPNQ